MLHLVSESELFIDLSTELLKLGHRVRFRPRGSSMHPTIKDSEVVAVEPVEPVEIARLDIILYLTVRGPIAHRVVRIEKRGENAASFITRGDASTSCDEPVEADQVIGRVVSVERDGRCINLVSRRAKLRHIVGSCASR